MSAPNVPLLNDARSLAAGERDQLLTGSLTFGELVLETWSPEFWDQPREAVLKLVRSNFLVKRRRHLLRGHPEQGKTLLLVDAARQWIEEGGHVVWLDYEMGDQLKDLMKDNGWTREHLRRFHYQYDPSLGEGDVTKAVKAFGADETLVVLDSLAGALEAAGLDEDRAADVGPWFKRNLEAVTAAGATAIAVEQEKQSATRKTRYGRASGRKLYGADVAWYVEKTSPWTRERSGRLRLTNRKDRPAVWGNDAELHFEVGDGRGGLPITLLDQAAGPEPGTVTPAPMHGRIIDYLQLHALGRDHAVSQSGIVGGIGGRKSTVLDALRELAENPQSPVHIDPRARINGHEALGYWFEEVIDAAPGLD